MNSAKSCASASAITWLRPRSARCMLRNLRPVPVDVGISLSAMARVVAYEARRHDGSGRRGTDAWRTGGRAGPNASICRSIRPFRIEPRCRRLALVPRIADRPCGCPPGTVIATFLIGVQFVGHGGSTVAWWRQSGQKRGRLRLDETHDWIFRNLAIITEATFKRPTPGPKFTLLAVSYHATRAEAFSAGLWTARRLTAAPYGTPEPRLADADVPATKVLCSPPPESGAIARTLTIK